MTSNTVDASTTNPLKHASLQQQQHFEHITALPWRQQQHHNKDEQQDTHLDDKTHITTYKATRYFVPKHNMLEHYRACLSTIELRSQCMCIPPLMPHYGFSCILFFLYRVSLVERDTCH